MTMLSDTRRRWFLAFGALALVATLAHAERAPVELGEVERGPLVEEIALNGTVTALRHVELSVSIGGLVRERTVDIGARIAQGDLLLRLDDELALLEYDRAMAEMREGERRLSETRRLLEQSRTMGGGRVIPATEQERRASEVDIAEAALARVKASERLQQAMVRRHALYAPFDGIVSARSVDAGQWVEPGDAVFTLVDTEHLLLDFQVPQHALALLDPNARLTIQLPSLGTRPAPISTWLPVTDPLARTFLLRAEAPEGARLLPGMAVSATLRLVRDEQALSVTRDAINRHPDGRVTVWVAEPAGEQGILTVREQHVRVSGSTGERIFVSEGLTGGERIVTRGNESLRNGAQVTMAGG